MSLRLVCGRGGWQGTDSVPGVVAGLSSVQPPHALGAYPSLVLLKLGGPHLLLPQLDLHRDIVLKEAHHQILRQVFSQSTCRRGSPPPPQ